eukprot:1015990_1
MVLSSVIPFRLLTSTIISIIVILYICSFRLASSLTECNSTPLTYSDCINKTLNDTEIVVKAYKGASSPLTSMTVLTYYGAYCEASFACHSIQFIHALQTSSVYGYGTHSCSNTTIISNTGGIYCRGSNACTFSTISSLGKNTLFCMGYGSCAHSHIVSIEYIDASGAYSLFGATIDTAISSLVYNNAGYAGISLNGDYAGYGATVRCRPGHQCDINCNVHTSCDMLFIDCLGDAICNVRGIYNASGHRNHNVFEYGSIASDNDQICNSA